MFGKVEMGVFALKSCIVTKKIKDFSKLDFCSSSIITLSILDQMTWFIPKNVTTFHEEKDGNV